MALISAANKAGANPPIAGQFVVYDLPDRDCAAAASNGELASASGGSARYKAEYIDVIRAKLQKYSDVKVILVIEPDSLANMITNLGVAKCSAAQSQYIENTIYAIKQLALPNVTMYLDGGHGGWLGWPANLALAAPFYAKLYKDAGVRVVPGSYLARPQADGSNPGDGYIRLALVQDAETTAEALRRLVEILK